MQPSYPVPRGTIVELILEGRRLLFTLSDIARNMTSNKFCVHLLVITVFLQIVELSKAQNCGFPSRPITLDAVREDFPVGKLLEKLRVVHVADDIQELPCTPGDIPFIKIETKAEEQQLEITLLQDTANLIDLNKLNECVITTKLKCADERKKEITLIIPLEDVNSKYPIIFQQNHELTVQLPWNCKVALNFNQPIKIEDDDRDFEHAALAFSSKKYSIFYATVDHERDMESTGPFMPHVFHTQVHLKDEHCRDFGMSLASQSFETNIHVFNEDNPKMGSLMQIRVRFTSSPDAFKNNPVFTQHIYKESIHIDGWKEGSPLLIVNTTESDQNSEIEYEMIEEDEYFAIDRNTGEVTLKSQPPLEYITNLKHHVGIYHIRASRRLQDQQQRLKQTTTTLLVYFEFEDPGSTTEFPTVTPPPGEFECQREGNFSDPEFCNIFHVCLRIGEDYYQDNRMCCAYAGPGQYLVFCEATEQCEFLEHAEPEGCSCPTESYDSTCPVWTNPPPPPVTSTEFVPESTTSNIDPTSDDGFSFTPSEGYSSLEPGTNEPDPISTPTTDASEEPEFTTMSEGYTSSQSVTTESVPEPTPITDATDGSQSTPSGEFECTSEGLFKDTEFCNVYHDCEYIANSGSYRDNRKCCASGGDSYLVFCEKEPSYQSRCEFVTSNCCSTGNFDTSCPVYSDQAQTAEEASIPALIRGQLSSTEATSPASISGFECWSEGKFEDPDYCNVYHTCEDTDVGYRDYRLCCPFAGENTFMQYCSPTRSCLTRTEAIKQGCECYHDTNDRSCNVRLI